MTDAIRLESVGKRYWKLEQPAMLLRSLLPFARQEKTELWAVRNLDLTVERGEVVGIIGGNGAGKTTLLRVLAGVTRPTEGTATVNGHVAPLIGVGVGFHPEMSGRENVYVNGMLLGLTEEQIDRRFDAIVEFAELTEFIDTPVKFYSSGMYMRLGFAVAVHTDPEVLLVDEVLAVGDLAFQMKCLERMQDIRQAGTTIVLVTHSMQAIRLLCRRVLVLNGGRVVFDGDAEAAIAAHLRLLGADSSGAPHMHTAGTPIEVVERSLVGPAGETHHAAGSPALRYKVRARVHHAVESPVFWFSVLSEEGTVVCAAQNPLNLRYRKYEAGDEIEAEFAFRARLMGGTYRVSTQIVTADGRGLLHADDADWMFYVDHTPWMWGVADLEPVVSIDGTAIEDPRRFGLSDET